MTTQQTVDIPLDLPTPSARDDTRRPPGSRSGTALRARPWPWPSALAALVILALLGGFYQVVREAVRQGEALRVAAASRAEAQWRCQSLRRAALRENCLAQLDAPVPEMSPSSPPPNTAALAAAGG
jgi:hypothetical protein